MSDSLPLALLHLRESEIVRICGLMHAARGQEHARQGHVTQPERSGGLLRATVLDGSTPRAVVARFAEGALASWECSCRAAAPMATALASATTPAPQRQPCEHVAALLSLWLRDAGQFLAPVPAEQPAPAAEAESLPANESATAVPLAGPAPEHSEDASRAGQSASAPAVPSEVPPMLPTPATLDTLDPLARRFLSILALAGGSATEAEAQRLFARLGLGLAEEVAPVLHGLQQAGWLQPMGAPGRRASRPLASAPPAGWIIPIALLAELPRQAPLEAVPSTSGLHEQLAEGARLPARLFLVAAQAVALPDTTAPAALLSSLKGQLGLPAEQAQFLLIALRLAGLLPGEATPPTPKPDASAVGAQPAQNTRPEADPAHLGLAAAQPGETLLRAYRWLLGRRPEEAPRDLLTLWLHARPARELADLRDAGVRVATLQQRDKALAQEIATENQAARAAVFDLLRAVPAGQWWSFASWVEWLWRLRPEFLRGRQQTFLRPRWWLERVQDGQALSPDVRADWRQAEGRYLALLFRRALHWLGLLDLAFDAQGRLQAFRITPLGARLLAAAPDDTFPGVAGETEPHTAAASAAVPPALRTQAVGTILLPLAHTRAATLEAALNWCVPAGATDEGVLLRPSAARVAASLDAGQDLDAWLTTLEQTAQKPPGAAALADAVALDALLARLRGWAARYGQIRLWPSVALLEVADPALLREVEQTLDLTTHAIDHLLAPNLAVLRSGALEPFLGELRRRGYAPWVIADEDAH